MDKYMVGLYFMSNLCIPSRLGQFEVKLMELCKLQLGIYLEHHCNNTKICDGRMMEVDSYRTL